MPRVVVIFHRLGPYHFARLRAAGRLLPVTAVETSGADETYAWDKVAGADGFERVTLFENADAQRQPNRDVARRMAAALDKIRPEVVVAPGWAGAAALGALRWSMEQGVPAVCMSESTEWDSKRRAWSEELKKRIVGMFSAALAGGSPHKDYMIKLGMPAERVFLGYDAVDGAYFAREAESAKRRAQSTERQAPSTLPHAPFFLASARFVEKKNLPCLIEAYARYRELASNSELRTPNSELWHLVLLGDGALRSSLESQVSSLGLQHCVLLPGFKQYPDLPLYYGLASAFIHPSTTEQWGLVVNEAMASGLPVLVSNRCGCAADLIQEGVNGFTFDPYNVEELAGLMLKISAFQDVSLSAFGNASRKIIADWGPERFAQGLKAAVDVAIKTGPQRASPVQRLMLKALLAR